ncbi:MAG: formyltransferase family protein, partial [Brevinematales bacterium]|nr:formyltransferase family protein [Brevinematales bacterium]
DIYVVVSYGMIIPENIIFHPPYHSINLHASLLPKYRGASPIQHALLNGDDITGNTVQFITKELDKGDIIIQSKVTIDPKDTYIELSKKLSLDGANLLLKALELIKKGNYERIKQDDAFASYTKIIKKENGLINFLEMKAKDIYNKYRAFKLWPGIFTFYKNSKEPFSDNSIKCILTNIDIVNCNGEAGKILKANKGGLVVGTMEQAIKINNIKPENKKEMDFISFINGFKPIEGNYF